AATGAAVDLAVDNETRAEPGTAGQVDQPRRASARAPPIFGERASSSVVLDARWSTEFRFQQMFERYVVPPGQVWWRVDDAAWRVQRSSNGDANAGGSATLVDQPARLAQQIVEHR